MYFICATSPDSTRKRMNDVSQRQTNKDKRVVPLGCPLQPNSRSVFWTWEKGHGHLLWSCSYRWPSLGCIRLPFPSRRSPRLPLPWPWAAPDSLPLDNSCKVEDVSEVLFLSRRMYSEIQRTVNRSGCEAGEPMASWVCSSTNSSKYGARYIRYQTNTITAPQNESDNKVLQTKCNEWTLRSSNKQALRPRNRIQAPHTKYEIGFRLLAP